MRIFSQSALSFRRGQTCFVDLSQNLHIIFVKTVTIANPQADISPEVRGVVIRGIHGVLQRVYGKMCIL